MRDWANIEVNHMRNNPELWDEFRSDYLSIFGEKINHNCKRQFYYKYQELINHLKNKKMAEKNGYQLKAKYNGLWFKGKLYRNEADGFLLDNLAKKLLKEHPAKENLFARMPKKTTRAKK
jgi:hypothetical protein